MYNVEKYIETTIASILANDMSDSELILVNDGSTDSTPELAAKAVRGHEDICRMIDVKNGGVSRARNLALGEAKGEYIIFVDSDDTVSPDLISTIRGYDEDVIAWTFRIVQGDDEALSNDLKEAQVLSGEEFLSRNLFEGLRVRLGSFAVRNRLAGGQTSELRFDPGTTFGEDTEYILKMMLTAGTVRLLPDTMYTYYKRSGSLAYSFNMRRFEALYAIGRVSRYINDNNIVVSDRIKEYIDNGLYVLHMMFSVESLKSYVSARAKRYELYRRLRCQYPDVLQAYKKEIRMMREVPPIISRKRLFLMRLGIGLYMIL